MRTFTTDQSNHQDIDSHFIGSRSSAKPFQNNDFLFIFIFLLLYLMEKEEKK